MARTPEALTLIDYLSDSGLPPKWLDAIAEAADSAMAACPEIIDRAAAKQVADDSLARIRERWGDDRFVNRMNAVMRFAQELDGKRPGFLAFMDSHLQISASPSIVGRLALFAERRYLN